MSVNKGLNFHVLVGNAPIHVKPEWGGGGGVTEGGVESGNLWEFDCDVYPQGGDFDRTSCIRSFNFK